MEVPDVMQPKEALNLLLLGRNGNGKSSTGNTILGGRHFTPSSSTADCDEEAMEKLEQQKGETCFRNRRITLVEGPGLGDANLDREENVRLTFQKIETSLNLFKEGFGAILFVLKYGVRFTHQEKETVLLVKRILGERVFVDYGVVVMTHGDSFELDMEDESKTFESWCREQTGDMRALLAECGYRVILFNNRKKADTGQDQVARLLELVEAVPGKERSYTKEEYCLAHTSRNKLLVSSKLPKLQKETLKILDEVHGKIMLLDLKSLVVDKQIELYKKLDDQKQMLLREDEGLGILKNILELIHVAEISLIAKEKIIRDTASLALFQNTLETPHCSKRPDNNSYLYNLYVYIKYRLDKDKNAADYKKIAANDSFPGLLDDIELHEHSTRFHYALESGNSLDHCTNQGEATLEDSFVMVEAPKFRHIITE